MSNIIEFVQNQESFFTPALVDEKSVTWGKESQFAIQAFQKNDFLAKTALNNQQSAQNAIINVAAIGVTLNPAAKHAYLVPRDGAVHLDISYMGLLHLAMQTGSILWGQCKLVRESDTYENQGLDSAPLHKYNAFGDRGNIIGGYCTVKTANGDYLTEEMSMEDIQKVQNTSKAKNGPWKTFFEEMARKTIVKRASKYWPNVERLDNAIHHLNEFDGIEKEPELAHYSADEIKKMENEQADQFNSEISELMDRMTLCESESQLKPLFAEAFNKTRGHKLQQNVQAVYAEMKEKLNV